MWDTISNHIHLYDGICVLYIYIHTFKISIVTSHISTIRSLFWVKNRWRGQLCSHQGTSLGSVFGHEKLFPVHWVFLGYITSVNLATGGFGRKSMSKCQNVSQTKIDYIIIHTYHYIYIYTFIYKTHFYSFLGWEQKPFTHESSRSSSILGVYTGSSHTWERKHDWHPKMKHQQINNKIQAFVFGDKF